MKASSRKGPVTRTPQKESRTQSNHYRRFGTVLSVNSPAVTPAGKKIARVRNSSAKKKHSTIPEETILFEGHDFGEEYTVTFDAGPIGLILDPTSCRVLRFLGDDSPARAAGLIQIGDVVVAVNGMPVESYNAANAILKDTSVRRSVAFQRHKSSQVVPEEGPENNLSVFPGRLNRAAVQTPPSRTSPSAKNAPPYSIEFISAGKTPTTNEPDASYNGDEGESSSGLLLSSVLSKAHRQNISVLEEADLTAIALSPIPELQRATAADEMQLTRSELQGAQAHIKQLQDQLKAAQAENEMLRQPIKQSNSAIKEMEYKMRIGGLEDELTHVRDSKNKLKERARIRDQELQEQMVRDRNALDQTRQELSNAAVTLKETLHTLDETRKELASTKKELHNETESRRREKDNLTTTIDKLTGNLDRSKAIKQQQETRIQQLVDGRNALGGELQRLKLQLKESDVHAVEIREQLLELIREKDAQLEALHLKEVSTHASLQADLSEKEGCLRRATAELDQLNAEKNSLVIELANFSSILEVAVTDKKHLEIQLLKMEDKLAARNQTIDSLKDEAKTQLDELCCQLQTKDEALVTSGEIIANLNQEKESLKQQLSELQHVAKDSNEEESRFRTSLESTQNELAGLRKSSVTEKYDLLKRIEGLEGDLLACHDTIQRQDDDLTCTRANLEAEKSKISRIASSLTHARGAFSKAVGKIGLQQKQIEALKTSAATKEREMAAMKEQCRVVAQEIEICTSKNHTLTSQVDKLLKAARFASTLEIKLRASLDWTKADLLKAQESAKSEKYGLLGELEKLQLQLSTSHQLVDCTKSEVAHALAKLDIAHSEITSLKNALSNVESDLKAAKMQTVRKEEQLESTKMAAKSKETELSRELALMTKRFTDSSSIINELTAKNSSLVATVQELRTAKKMSTAATLKLSLDLERTALELQESRSSAEMERKELHAQLETHVAELIESRKLVETTKKSLSNATAELAAYNAEVQRLSSALSASEANFIASNSAVEEGKAIIQTLKEAYEDKERTMRDELAEKSDQLAELHSELVINVAELSKTRQIVGVTETRLSDALAEIGATKLEVQRLSSALEASEAEFAESVHAADEAHVQIVSLKEAAEIKLREVENELGEKSDELIELHAQLETHVAELTESRQLVGTTKKSLSNATAELAATNEEVQRLSNALLVSEANFVASTIAVEEGNAIIHTLRDELAEKSDQLAELHSELEINVAELSKTRQIVGVTETRLSDALAEIGATKLEVQRLSSALAASEAKFAESVHAADEAHVQIVSLKEAAEIKLREAENELGEKSDELIELHAQLETHVAELTESRQLVGSTKKSLSNATAELAATNAEVQRLSNALLVSEANFVASTNAVEEGNAIMHTLRDELAEKSDQLAELHSELEINVAELSKTRQIVGVTETRLSDALAEIGATKLEVQRLSSALEASEAEFAESVHAADEAHVQIVSLKEAAEIKLREVENELGEKSDELIELHAQLETHVAELTESRQLVGTTKKSLSNATAELAATNEEVQRLSNALLVSEANFVASTIAVEEGNAIIHTLRDELAEKSDQLAELHSELEINVAELSKTRQIVGVTETRLSDALAEIGATKLEVQRLSSALEASEAEFAESVHAADEAHVQIVSLKEAAEIKLREVENELGEKSDELIELHAQLETHVAELTESRQLVGSTKKSLSNATAELAATNAEVQRLSNALLVSEANFVASTNAVEEGNAIIHTLRDELAEKSDQLAELHSELEINVAELSKTRQIVGVTATRLSDALAEIGATKLEVQRLSSALEASEAKFAESAHAADEAHVQIVSLKEAAEIKLREVENELGEKSDELIELHAQLETHVAELIESRQLVGTTKKSLSNATAELAATNAEVQRLSSALSASEANFIASNSAVEEGKAIIEALKMAYEDEKRTLVDVLARKCEQLYTFFNAIKTLTGDMDFLQNNHIDTRSSLHDSLKSYHADAVQRLLFTYEANEMLAADNLKLKTALDHVIFSVQARVTETEDLKRDAAELQQWSRSELAIRDQTIGSLTLEKDSLVKTINETNLRADKVNSTLRADAEQLRLQLAKTEADFQNIQVLTDKKGNELEAIYSKLIAAKARNDKLLIELKQSESNLDSLTRLLDSSNAQIASLKETSVTKQQQFQRELEESRQDLSTSQNAIESLTHKNAKLSERLRLLQIAISHAKDAESKLRAEIDEKKSELAAEKSSSCAFESELRQRVEILNLDLQDRQSLIEKRDRNIAAITEELASAKMENEFSLSQLSQLREDLEVTKLKSSTLERRLEESERKKENIVAEAEEKLRVTLIEASEDADFHISEARNEVSHLMAKVHTLTSSNTEAAEEIKRLKSSVSILSAEAHQLRTTIDVKENEISQLQTDLTDMSNDLEATKAVLEQKNEYSTVIENTLDEAQGKVLELEARVTNIVSESSRSRDSMTSEVILLKQNNADLASENTEMEMLLRSMGKKLTETESLLEKACEELRVEREVLNELKASSISTQSSLERKIETLNAESEKNCELSRHLNDECISLKSELRLLREKVHSLNERHKVAESRIEAQDLAFSCKEQELLAQISAEKDRATSFAEQVRVLKFERDQGVRESATVQRRLNEQILLLEYEAALKAKRQTEWVNERGVEMKCYRQCREDLRVASNKISRLEESVTRARVEIDQFAIFSEQRTEESTCKIESLSQVHDTEIRRIKDEKDELEHALRKAEDDRESATTRLLAAEANIRETRLERDKAVAAKYELTLALHETKDAFSELQCQLGNCQNLSHDSNSTDSYFKQLSTRDIESRCLDLQSELSDAENRLVAANDDVARRSERCQRLAGDLDSMSNEIGSLVAANDLLEARLSEVTSQKELAESSALEAQKKTELLDIHLLSMKEQLDKLSTQNMSTMEELHSLKIVTNSKSREHASRKHDLEEDLAKLKLAFSDIKREKDDTVESLSGARNDLSLLKEQYLKSSERILQLEFELAETNTKLTAASKQDDFSRVELLSKIDHYEQLLSALETENTALRTRATEIELKLESNNLALQEKDEKERTLLAELDKGRRETQVAENMLKEVVAKLAEASKVVALQEDAIKSLESRARESEQTALSLSDIRKKLQASLRNKELSSDADVALCLQQIHELESKCRSMEEERSVVNEEASSLRDELRLARRKSLEYTKTSATLQTRINTLRDALDSTKAQLMEARSAKDESRNSCRQLETELDNKQMEVDHLKAKVQVLTAASARLKANNLLQEAANHKTNQTSESNAVDEVLMLRSELQARSAKLESLAEVYKSQQQVHAHCQSLEGQLIRFIEDIIAQNDNILAKISTQSEKLYAYADNFALEDEIEALDLAGFEKHEKSLALFCSNLDSLALLIPHAITQLDEKRVQLESWKQQRSVRVAPKPSTPNANHRRSVPNSPAIMESFQIMKAVLNEKILSPNKIRTSNSDRLDVEHLKKVIHLLEGQIDGLVTDLQAANEALHAKDMLFADLELLVSHHESARGILDRKIAALEARVKEDVSLKQPAEKEQEGLPFQQFSTLASVTDLAPCKLAAARLLVHAIDGRANAAKAVSFRQWTCQTSALRAMAKQGHASANLARELEETRKKLAYLKQLMKKTRRRARDVGGLDCIAEDSEK